MKLASTSMKEMCTCSYPLSGHKFLLSNLNYKYNKNYGTREYIIADLG
jgi:hypothetical protein